MPTSDIFFENLSSFCNYSQSPTSVVLHIGCICSHELANIQLLFNNQHIFGTLDCLDYWKTPFCKISQLPRPMWVLQIWVWLVKFCVQIIEVSDNRGLDTEDALYFIGSLVPRLLPSLGTRLISLAVQNQECRLSTTGRAFIVYQTIFLQRVEFMHDCG